MRRIGSLRFATLLALIIGTGGAWAALQRAEAADASVQIAGFAFAPASVTVNVGESVTWTHNDGGIPHSVAFTGGPSSPTLNQGGTYVRTFEAPGTFNYQCGIHPAMTGSVTVAGAQQATPTPTNVPPTPTNTSAPAATSTPAPTATPTPGNEPTATGTPSGEPPTSTVERETPTPTPAAPGSTATPSTPAPTGTPANGTDGDVEDEGGGNAWWIIAAVAMVIVVVGGGGFALSRRG